MNSYFLRSYRWFQLLSLDVVLGAVGWHLTFLRFPEGEHRAIFTSPVVLALSIWIIYVIDRLLDTYRGQRSSARHQFHYDYQFNLVLGIFAAGSIAFCLVFFLPTPVIQLGIVLFLAVLVYFLIIHRWNKRSYRLKQWAIPLAFGGAVLGTAWVQLPVIALSMWVVSVQWLLVLSQNLRLFQYFESDSPTPPTWIRWVAVGQLFAWIILFGGTLSYTAGVSALLTGVSLVYALLPAFPRIRPVFRGWVDGVLLAGWLSFLF